MAPLCTTLIQSPSQPPAQISGCRKDLREVPQGPLLLTAKGAQDLVNRAL